jgi:hypothetical protein
MNGVLRKERMRLHLGPIFIEFSLAMDAKHYRTKISDAFLLMPSRQQERKPFSQPSVSPVYLLD